MGSHYILAIYATESEFERPLFADVNDCGKQICNNKHMMIPMGEKSKTHVCIQMKFNDKFLDKK